ncbi:GntR family transcriptional regulator, partial [Streptomyces sp. NPDC059506]|uniref:GntR family transcriptional regulator n=1 Tax=Streptomyces sp. NPDC059506 TaxID=3347751 RepID=UPI0036C0DD57
MKDYRSVADAVAEDIGAGRLRAGDRLPPQRDFARQHGIANSTAIRVYRELARRGLTVGEVGRGTFVRAASGATAPALSEPADGRVDLALNHPVAPGQAGLLAAGLGGQLRPDALESALRPGGPAGPPPPRGPPPPAPGGPSCTTGRTRARSWWGPRRGQRPPPPGVVVGGGAAPGGVPGGGARGAGGLRPPPPPARPCTGT